MFLTWNSDYLQHLLKAPGDCYFLAVSDAKDVKYFKLMWRKKKKKRTKTLSLSLQFLRKSNSLLFM